MTGTAPAYLVSPAWLLDGMRTLPGYLGSGEGRVTFVSDEPVFDVPVEEVGEVSWPWHWFGSGCRLTAAGQRYKVTFVRPNGMPAPRPSMLQTGVGVFGVLTGALPPGSVGDLDALRGLADIGAGRAAAARWKQVLGG